MRTLIAIYRLSTVLIIMLVFSACNTLNDGVDDNSVSGDIQPAGHFIWHDLIAHDLDAARKFYGGLFGWEFEQAEERDGQPYILAKLDGLYAGGIIETDRPGDGEYYSRWLGYMTVDNIDRALATTRSQGGHVIKASQDLGAAGKVAAITDSQGAVLGLIETRLDPRGLTLSEAAGAIIWNELLASDSHAAAAFYSALSGAQSNSITRRGGRYIMLKSGGTARAGILKNPFAATDPLWLSYFAVSDLAATTARVEALGGKVILPPSAELREGSMALIQDPDGAVLALQKWPL